MPKSWLHPKVRPGGSGAIRDWTGAHADGTKVHDLFANSDTSSSSSFASFTESLHSLIPGHTGEEGIGSEVPALLHDSGANPSNSLRRLCDGFVLHTQDGKNAGPSEHDALEDDTSSWASFIAPGDHFDWPGLLDAGGSQGDPAGSRAGESDLHNESKAHMFKAKQYLESAKKMILPKGKFGIGKFAMRLHYKNTYVEGVMETAAGQGREVPESWINNKKKSKSKTPGTPWDHVRLRVTMLSGRNIVDTYVPREWTVDKMSTWLEFSSSVVGEASNFAILHKGRELLDYTRLGTLADISPEGVVQLQVLLGGRFSDDSLDA